MKSRAIIVMRLLPVIFLFSLSFSSLVRADVTPLAEPLALSTPDINTHRLGFGLRGVNEVYDYEFFHVPTWQGRTELGDYVNPFFEYHYNDYAALELGAITEYAYGGNQVNDANFGDSNELVNTQAWIRLSTHPTKNTVFRLGDLAYPHAFYSPIYFAPAQYENKLTEKGIQILYDNKGESWLPRNDFFFAYEHQDLTTSPLEQFDWGDVMQGRWGHWRGDYQADWIHQGGQQTAPGFPVEDTNDTVQLIGPGLDFTHWGLTADYLISHYSVQYSNGVYGDTKGNAQFLEAYTIWGHLRFSYIYWNMFQWRHGDTSPNTTDVVGNPVFEDHPWVQAFSTRWNSTWNDFVKITLEYVGYNFPGATPGKFLPIESEIHMRASYEFHVPILEWTTKKGPPLETDPDFQTAPAGSAGPEFNSLTI